MLTPKKPIEVFVLDLFMGYIRGFKGASDVLEQKACTSTSTGRSGHSLKDLQTTSRSLTPHAAPNRSLIPLAPSIEAPCSW